MIIFFTYNYTYCLILDYSFQIFFNIIHIISHEYISENSLFNTTTIVLYQWIARPSTYSRQYRSCAGCRSIKRYKNSQSRMHAFWPAHFLSFYAARSFRAYSHSIVPIGKERRSCEDLLSSSWIGEEFLYINYLNVSFVICSILHIPW